MQFFHEPLMDLPLSMRVIHRHERRTHILYRVNYPRDEAVSIDDIVRRLPDDVKISVHRTTCAHCDDDLQLQLYVPKRAIDVVERSRTVASTLADVFTTCVWLVLSCIVATDAYMCVDRTAAELL
eukprot:gene1640-2285_t